MRSLAAIPSGWRNPSISRERSDQFGRLVRSVLSSTASSRMGTHGRSGRRARGATGKRPTARRSTRSSRPTTVASFGWPGSSAGTSRPRRTSSRPPSSAPGARRRSHPRRRPHAPVAGPDRGPRGGARATFAPDVARQAHPARRAVTEIEGPHRDHVDEAAGQFPERLALRQALAGLSVAQRAVVVLHLHAGYTLDETAEILGIPRETVRSRLRVARDQLRHALEEGSDGPPHLRRAARPRRRPRPRRARR